MKQKNILIRIEYDGNGFSGWQIQPDRRTVQGTLEDVLSRVCGEEIHINGTSRTDAGVHAYGQCASFSGTFGIPTDRIPIAANHLFPDIKITSAEEKDSEFHARFSAVGKTYLYRISVSDTPDIFMRNYRYQLKDALDAGKMIEVAKALEGTHDFSAFHSSGSNEPETAVRTIHRIDMIEYADRDTKGMPTVEYEIRVTGDGFLYHMVRIIVGTLTEAGVGEFSVEKAKEALLSGKRACAGHTAPASGLWLEKIYFDEIEVSS
ncbi:MAG: tRNA pseudouridine(38-40) synthase TruA [Clostridiales Family XIII bacterium]|nr:tRNA pseudouridine(38-40) synthase TruA [Clostridiales Family XIII bacterium]